MLYEVAYSCVCVCVCVCIHMCTHSLLAMQYFNLLGI